MNKKDYRETDLYPPVKMFFEALGYQVNGEVSHCDVTLYKDGRLIVIELKKAFNLPLLYQALDRQAMADEVYMAIPRPRNTRNTAYRHMLRITQKLGLGLLTVAMDSPVKTVDILIFPEASIEKPLTKRQAAKKDRVIQEIAGRTLDLNAGGSTKTKLVTAYRERAIHIACALALLGPQKPSVLVRIGCPTDTYNILYSNAYGWFQRVDKALYALSNAGMAALDTPQYTQLITHYRESLCQSTSAPDTEGQPQKPAGRRKRQGK